MTKLKSVFLFLAVAVAIATGSHLRTQENNNEDMDNNEVAVPDADATPSTGHRELWWSGWRNRWGRPRPAPLDIVGTAQNTPELSFLVEVLGLTNLVQALQGDGPFTVFAPTNSAFYNALTALGVTQEQFKAAPEPALANILARHVLGGRELRTIGFEFRHGGPFTSLNQVPLTTARYRAGRWGPLVKTVNGARIISSDISTSNGVVHVVDQVLMPPAELAALFNQTATP